MPGCPGLSLPTRGGSAAASGDGGWKGWPLGKFLRAKTKSSQELPSLRSGTRSKSKSNYSLCQCCQVTLLQFKDLQWDATAAVLGLIASNFGLSLAPSRRPACGLLTIDTSRPERGQRYCHVPRPHQPVGEYGDSLGPVAEARAGAPGRSFAAIHPTQIGSASWRFLARAAVNSKTPRSKAAIGRELAKSRPSDIPQQMAEPGSRNPRVSAPLRLCVDFTAFPTKLGQSVEALTNLARRNRPGTDGR
jgi:hypothetical protein